MIPQKPSYFKLLTRAALALFRWGRTGFALVDGTVLQRRENACMACPNLQEPVAVIQTFIFISSHNDKPGQRTGNKVCQLCGCNASKKMLLLSEACPATDLDSAGFTRWGEAAASKLM